MIHDSFRPRFLGQVRLGTPVSRPGVDPVQYIDPSGSTSFSTPGRDISAPASGCVLIGYKFDNADAVKEIEAKKAQASKYGYTDIREVELPPCDVAPGFESPWESLINPSCMVGNGNQHMAIWACPGPDHERIVQENKVRATQGCEFLFLSEGIFDSSDKQDRINAEISAGRKVIRIYTGKILNRETKSEQRETEVWSCPRLVAGAQPPPPVAAAAPPSLPLPLPLAPVEKPDLVPVAAGAGVVAILAAIIGGAFGK